MVFIAQEILVDHASYPTKRIAANSHRFRPIGLGYSNLGSLIMTAGLPYDSDEARGLCGAITAILHGAACHTSTELAAAVGPFDDYEKNREPMLHVMEMHWEKVEEIKGCPKYLQEAARNLWDKVLAHGKRHGFRNAQATVLAPTGTISFMMDCDTTGIEPDIALVKYKQLAGGGMLKIVNQEVPLALRTLGYDDAQIESIVAYIDKHDTIEGAAELKPEHLPVFDCAFPPRNGRRSIPWRAHIQMMAAAQPFISGAISKTVNMPKESTPDDVADAYMEGWRLGLEGPGHLSRRLEGGAAALHEEQGGQGGRKASSPPAPRTPARHPPVDHPQVQRLGPRGLHHGGPLSRRPARRTVHHHGQGRQHDRRADGLLRHGRLDEPAIRRAAGGLRQQVLAHPLRAAGLHQEPRHQDRQEPGRLHLPLAGHHLPAGLPRGQQGRAAAVAGRSGEPRSGRNGSRDLARRHEGRRAQCGPGIGQERKLAQRNLVQPLDDPGGQWARRAETCGEAQRHARQRRREGSR